MPELDAENAKLVLLARSARARTGAPEGAAVRDDTGRTYAASTVVLPSLRLSALQAAVAAAVSSGAGTLEAAAVVTDVAALAPADLGCIRELGGPGVPVHVAGTDGAVRSTVST
ncbi:MAG TPA: cytidine deaminase [Mycobacteriales bacterium]|nr:cytidine deaminase [Mycobacteriales bacterium]